MVDFVEVDGRPLHYEANSHIAFYHLNLYSNKKTMAVITSWCVSFDSELSDDVLLFSRSKGRVRATGLLGDLGDFSPFVLFHFQEKAG